MSGTTDPPPDTVVTPITQRILARLPGCTMPVVNMELRACTGEFLRKTLLWRTRFEITVLKDVGTYALVPPQGDAGTVATRLLSVWYGDHRLLVSDLAGFTPNAKGDPRVATMSNPLDVTIWPIPDGSNTIHKLTLDVAWTIDPVQLASDTLVLPHATLNHLETLTDGTLGRLYSMADKSWTSRDDARIHYGRFLSGCFEARHAVDTGRALEGHNNTPQWRFPRFA
jgi:hypothetical protein